MSEEVLSELNRCRLSLERLQHTPEFLALPGESREAVVALLDKALKDVSQAETLLSTKGLTGSDGQTKQDIWGRKLLDLSFRNALLNMRLGKRALAVDSDNVHLLFKRLRNGEEILVDDLFPAVQEAERIKLTKGLFRIARTSLEESGANTLFLAFGILRYNEEGGQAASRTAPLLLLPVNMVRCAKDRYTLRMRDEETVINQSLLLYLSQAIGLQISTDALITDTPELNPGQVFQLIRNAISSKEGWEVDECCILGVFSFTKYVMWYDLHQNREAYSSHPVLRSLMEGRLLLETTEMPDARKMDKELAPDSFAMTMDYDSSQLEAVADSDRGSSFILYGPPGTGKSQTITNIISNATSKGRRVLFVAEKKAALEVVQHRLDLIGIGPFCLELYGDKVDKRHFLNQMEKVLSIEADDVKTSYKQAGAELYARRLEILEQNDSLHRKGDSDWSLSECIEGYLTNEGQVFALPSGWTVKKTKADVEQVRRLCLALDAGPAILGMAPTDFPLYGVTPKKQLSGKDVDNLVSYLKDSPAYIDAAVRQESSDMNRKFLNKTVFQILSNDYRWRRITQFLDIDPKLYDDVELLKEKVSIWAGSMALLPDWLRYLEPIEALKGAGLDDIVRLFLSGLSGEESFMAFLKSFFYRAALDKIVTDPGLSRFNGMTFSQTIDSYLEETAAFQHLTRLRLCEELTSRIPFDTRDPVVSKELTYLKRCIASKGRGVSIRGIIEHIPHLMPRLCPCVLMSPLSVAQYIPMGSQEFDMVIFDEASQMPTSEAVGAIARAKSVIVVGDPQQMPPSDFFSADVVGEEENEEDDLDSILDDCIALSMPSHHLKWHYRSQHESLIAFCNKEFYDGSLVTFPSVDNLKSRVILHPVEGIYDYGKTRCNRLEAEAVVTDVIERLKDNDPRSIGIVAFSKSQRDLIEDLLLEALTADKKLENRAFKNDEPLFVKNLENVQGDERDVILFSIGYGPDERGFISMNFGPLNKVGGERRLNVALTRARSEMDIFSSMDAGQIDLRRTKSEGALALKRFLEYAEKNACATAGCQEDSPDNLLVQIAEAISGLGYQVDTGIGASSFKVDLAVVAPNDSGRYILGIIIDGDDYYKMSTVRDREVTRPMMLTRLGWEIMRVWTMDWFLHPEQVILKIKEKLDICR